MGGPGSRSIGIRGCRAVPDSLHEIKPRALHRSHQGLQCLSQDIVGGPGTQLVSVENLCGLVGMPDGFRGPRHPMGLCVGPTLEAPGDQSTVALGQMCWYLQEVGQEAGVIRWRGRRWGWRGQRLLQSVSLGAQSPWHHVGIWLREGCQVQVSPAGLSPARPRVWLGAVLTTPKDSSWCSGSWDR